MARTRAASLRPRIQAPAASEITHTRFLVSAERLFCVNGYEGTKIRAIATLSNANLGMLSHYWGSKRALFREVFDRRLRPIHEERMRRFRVLEKNHEDGQAGEHRRSVAGTDRTLVHPARPVSSGSERATPVARAAR